MKVEDYLAIFERVAEKKGWRVNPDGYLARSFAEGLIKNRKRYGLPICPCRIATGKREIDRLIVCPCVYAEDDIEEYGRCYCGLYMSDEYLKAGMVDVVVPDRHLRYYLEL